jgi:pyruvate formate lyase activating enzyme
MIISLAAGLHRVFTGNVLDTEGGTTFCPGCHAALFVRDRYDIRRYDLTPGCRWPHCSTAFAGPFGKALGRDGRTFGQQRIPVHLGA